MIFYFSATGNSQSVAEQIASALGERLISIGLALRDKQYSFDVSNDEYIGFVLPTFAYTLPGAAAIFIDKLQLNGYKNQYTFGVFTCGASTGDEGAALNLALKNKNLGFNGSFDVVMPDNFIMWSNLPSEESIAAKLAAAREKVNGIISAVKKHDNGKISDNAPRMPFMPTEKISTAAKTSKFYVTDKCVGCGNCANVCPMSCIHIADSEPVWEGECTLCLACLHRCPHGAVEYENQTLSKKRYQNPDCKVQLKNKY